MTVPVPHDEAERLRALRSLDILDTPPEQAYDDVVALASAICGTPVAMLNFIDADRQWGKALLGLESSEAPREQSFCARTILAEDGLMVVEDTLRDPAWAHHVNVQGAPHLRFYAGAAIRTSAGHALGTVCVVDQAPHHVTAGQEEALRILARQTAAQLELRAASAELRRMAIEDPLTRLPNRTLLLDRLDHELRRLRRRGGRLGVLFGDLDGFKGVNDDLGHHAGDDLLRLVAERLRGAAREADTVARLAGDEFVVVCPDAGDAGDLAALTARLEVAVARPALVSGEPVTPRMSIGAISARPLEDAGEVLRRADAAMYRRKAARVERALVG